MKEEHGHVSASKEKDAVKKRHHEGLNFKFAMQKIMYDKKKETISPQHSSYYDEWKVTNADSFNLGVLSIFAYNYIPVTPSKIILSHLPNILIKQRRPKIILSPNCRRKKR